MSDYVSALSIADELGLGLIASGSTDDVQHMGLLATLLAKILRQSISSMASERAERLRGLVMPLGSHGSMRRINQF